MVSHGLCYSYKLESFEGVHDLSSDILRLALYTSVSSVGPDSTLYTIAGECDASGYTPGGVIVPPVSGFPKLNDVVSGDVAVGTMALMTFMDALFPAMTTVTSLRGAMLYNSTKGNRAIFVVDFGQNVALTNETLTIQWPTADPINALLRAY